MLIGISKDYVLDRIKREIGIYEKLRRVAEYYEIIQDRLESLLSGESFFSEEQAEETMKNAEQFYEKIHNLRDPVRSALVWTNAYEICFGEKIPPELEETLEDMRELNRINDEKLRRIHIRRLQQLAGLI